MSEHGNKKAVVGQTATEYLLVVMIISILAIVVLAFISSDLKVIFSRTHSGTQSRNW